MEKTHTCVKRDAILKARIVSLEHVLEMYRVRRKSGLDGVEEGDELQLFDIDVDEEPWTMESRTWRRLCSKIFLET